MTDDPHPAPTPSPAGRRRRAVIAGLAACAALAAGVAVSWRSGPASEAPAVPTVVYTPLDAGARERLDAFGPLERTDAVILGSAADPFLREVGASLWRGNCSQCHAADGGGGTGPNLCDEFAANVTMPADYARIIDRGVLHKGMPAWGLRLSNNEIVALAAHAAALRGTTPANPLAPLGEPMPPWDDAAAMPR